MHPNVHSITIHESGHRRNLSVHQQTDGQGRCGVYIHNEEYMYTMEYMYTVEYIYVHNVEYVYTVEYIHNAILWLFSCWVM